MCYRSKTYPSFLNLKEGSTFLTKPLFPQEREDVTALWCSEPLRSKVGGPSKVFAMIVRDGTAWVLGISPIQRHHYITSSYTYQFFEKSYFVSILQKINCKDMQHPLPASFRQQEGGALMVLNQTKKMKSFFSNLVLCLLQSADS